MATPGKVKGSDYYIMTGDTGSETQLIGQLEGTMTIGGEPIDVTNKSSQEFIELFDGVTTSKQITFSGSLHYNNDAAFEAVRAAAFSGSHINAVVKCGESGETYTGNFQVSGVSDTAPVDGTAVTTAVNFGSSGVVVRTPITTTP